MSVTNGANHNTNPTIRTGVSYSKQSVRETNDAFSQAKKKQSAKLLPVEMQAGINVQPILDDNLSVDNCSGNCILARVHTGKSCLGNNCIPCEREDNNNVYFIKVK